MKKTILSLLVALMATTGATAQIAVSGTGNSRTFAMPTYDVEVTTELWYKLSETATDNETNYDTKTNVFLERILNPGVWNSFCAPFAIDDPASVFGTGVQVKQLTAANISGGTLTLTFGNASSIAAATPYLIKLSGEDAVNLAADGKEFAGVTQSYTAVPVTYGGVTFRPTLVPQAITSQAEQAEKTILFLTSTGKITWPSADGTIKAFRAYFDLGTNSAREFKMDFGDELITGVIGVTNTDRTNDTDIYDLQGRKVQNASQKGVYIQNGKKVVLH